MEDGHLDPGMRECISAVVKAHRNTAALDPARLARRIAEAVPVEEWVNSLPAIEEEIIRAAVQAKQPLRLDGAKAA